MNAVTNLFQMLVTFLLAILTLIINFWIGVLNLILNFAQNIAHSI